MEGLNFNDELARIATFNNPNWPSDVSFSANVLARHGFYYTGSGYTLKCYKCGSSVDCTRQRDDVEELHRCARVSEQHQIPNIYRESASNNTDKQDKDADSNKPKMIDDDDDVKELMNKFSKSPEWHLEPKAYQRSFEHQVRFSEANRFGTKEARLATYNESWPSNCPVPKEELAEAGWIYTGRSDRVYCPWCHGSVYTWETGDTALGEHKKYFPRCQFVNQNLKKALTPLVPRKIKIPSDILHKPCVIAVEDLGYTEEEVKEALRQLEGKGVTKKELNTDAIMDELIEMEEHGDLHSSKNSPPSEAKHISKSKKLKLDTSKGNKKLHITQLKTIDEMKKDVERMKTTFTCKVCLDQTVSDLFLPCRHLICCKDCSAGVHDCPVCRARIKYIIKAFI